MTSRTSSLLDYWGTPEKALAMAQAQARRNTLPDKALNEAIKELKKMAKKEAEHGIQRTKQ